MNTFFLIIIGGAAGLLSGILGIGGGIIIVPALIYFCGFSQTMAQGTSIAVLLPPVGLFAFLEYYKNGNVDIKAGIIICIMMLLGAFVGAKFANAIPENILRKCFAALLFIISINMFLRK